MEATVHAIEVQPTSAQTRTSIKISPTKSRAQVAIFRTTIAPVAARCACILGRGDVARGRHAGREGSQCGQCLTLWIAWGVRDNTNVVFASDNGPEFVRSWGGWAGPRRGQYFTAWEGGIRVPFMTRWPGKVRAGRVSDEIVHGVDLFPTLSSIAGASVPNDRPIDGVDQSSFF